MDGKKQRVIRSLMSPAKRFLAPEERSENNIMAKPIDEAL
jgi:hypothetical protein